MEGQSLVDSHIDYALFKVSSFENRYEALICNKGGFEKLSHGNLNRLVMHLPQANKLPSNTSHGSFKLQPSESIEVSSWFTKFTLARFLHIINSPELITSANAIISEMSQLEDARKFHLMLYSKDHQDHSEVVTADMASEQSGSLKDFRPVKDVISEISSSDATKNELLRAMDVRLVVLKEELGSLINEAAGAPLSTKQVSHLAAFAQHFGIINLRGPLSKFLSLIPKDQMVEEDSPEELISDVLRKNTEENADQIVQRGQEIDTRKPRSSGFSPAKIAQAERQISSESEDSSESCDEDHPCAERSRPTIRSASPRRSASPMRRIQIGRSGSRRSTSLAIKSLNYFPAREKLPNNRDTEENNSMDEESEQPSKKIENTVRRMSVQDAISLFESKQKDQNFDIQKRKPSAEVSLTTNKTVLRIWSAGMGDSLVQSQDITSDTSNPQSISINVTPDAEEQKMVVVNVESDCSHRCSDAVNSDQIDVLSEEVNVLTTSSNPSDMSISHEEKVKDRLTASAKWTKQKEAELNQMLIKMTENRPGKYRSRNPNLGGARASPTEQKGGLYSQYKEKRDEKLRAGNAGKQPFNGANHKVQQENFEQGKAGMISKLGVISKKQDLSSNAQRIRRNSSPPVPPKKEVSKVAAPKKASPKSLPLPTTRASWSSGPLPKTSGTKPTKTSTRVTPTNTTPTRRKSLPIPSPTPPSPKTERPFRQPKGNLATKTNSKLTTITQEEKTHKSTVKSNKSTKPRALSAYADDYGSTTGKPSFYSKVTRKTSVVPLEVKPFLKKGTRIGPGVGSVLGKTKDPNSDGLSRNSENLVQIKEKESIIETAEPTNKVLEIEHAQAKEIDANLDAVPDDVSNLRATEKFDQSVPVTDDNFEELIVVEIQPDEDISISSAAWVDTENQEISSASGNTFSSIVVSAAPMQAVSSSRVRHSLSQMLQADNNEPEIIEWGNAENPPALVYQKDTPKGLKRLLNFARKGRTEAHLTGFASPSEGEDDMEDSKGENKNCDVARKGSLQTRGSGQQKTMLNETLDCRNSSNRTVDCQGVDEALSAQLKDDNLRSLSSDKLRDFSSTPAATKASRSFFSLSAFRSSKSSETKLR